MARTVTLATLRSDIRWQSDQIAGAARHTDAAIDRAINQSIQRFREKVSQHGIRYYLISNTGALPVGAAAPYPFGLLSMAAWSPGVVRLFGLDVTVQGRAVRLEPVDFEARAEFQRAEVGVNANAPPAAFAPYGPDSIALLPASDAAYPYVAWYLPVLADLVAPLNPFDGMAGWEEWIVWDVTIKLINRDQYANAYQMAIGEREAVWLDIEKNAPRKVAGNLQRQDVRALKEDRIRLYRNWVGR